MRTYNRAECAVFCKTREQYGGYSNMAAGYPLVVNGLPIRTAEALYQALRFPSHPEVQREILDKKSPMAAKMVAKHHRDLTRPDWMEVRVPLMWYSLRVKIAQHLESFGALLRASGTMDIVEESHNDDFWGAVARPDGTLVGHNYLGKLLRQIRTVLAVGSLDLRRVPPPPIVGVLLLGEQLRPIVPPEG